MTQLVNYAWGGNDYPSMRVNNECLSKKKRYFYFFFLFSCNFRTITLSFKKKLSPWHRGKCHSNPGVSSHFRASWQHMCSMKITGYEKKSQFCTVVWEVKSEFLLGLLFCCAVYFLRFCKVLKTFSSRCVTFVLDIIDIVKLFINLVKRYIL